LYFVACFISIHSHILNASYAASVILRVTYGKSTPTATDAPEIVIIHKMLKRFQMLMRPGALLVERYPILKYVPGYASYLEEWRKEESQLFHDQLDRVSKELVGSCNMFSKHYLTSSMQATGNAGPSFARYLLENQSSHKLSDEEMAYLAGSLFGAGSDTTAVAIMVVVMAAACYPKAQEKVQEELDVVIGRDRGVSKSGNNLSEKTKLNLVITAPTFDDYSSLPQIEAFMLECLRWRPVTTLGFAHRALTDIVYVRFLLFLCDLLILIITRAERLLYPGRRYCLWQPLVGIISCIPLLYANHHITGQSHATQLSTPTQTSSIPRGGLTMTAKSGMI